MRDHLNSERCCTYLRALAEPDRLRIVQWLQQHGPISVGKLSRGLGAPTANVSHHLKQLRYAGLVSPRKQGRFVMYELASGIVIDRDEGGLNLGCCHLKLGPAKARSSGRRVARPTGKQT